MWRPRDYIGLIASFEDQARAIVICGLNAKEYFGAFALLLLAALTRRFLLVSLFEKRTSIILMFLFSLCDSWYNLSVGFARVHCPQIVFVWQISNAYDDLLLRLRWWLSKSCIYMSLALEPATVALCNKILVCIPIFLVYLIIYKSPCVSRPYSGLLLLLIYLINALSQVWIDWVVWV